MEATTLGMRSFRLLTDFSFRRKAFEIRGDSQTAGLTQRKLTFDPPLSVAPLPRLPTR